MTLSQSHRTHIHQCLVPILGDDAAEALMTEFPSTEHDELVTKQYLRAELAELRGDLEKQIGQLRTDMEKQIGGLRTEMAEGFGQLRTEIAASARTTMATMIPTVLVGMGIAAAIG